MFLHVDNRSISVELGVRVLYYLVFEGSNCDSKNLQTCCKSVNLINLILLHKPVHNSFGSIMTILQSNAINWCFLTLKGIMVIWLHFNG